MEMHTIMKKEYRFKAKIIQNEDMDAGYIVFPYDIRKEFGKGRVKVHVLFDDEGYDGSIVNMGLKDENGEIIYIIGITRAIRKKIDKSFGDEIDVVISERE